MGKCTDYNLDKQYKCKELNSVANLSRKNDYDLTQSYNRTVNPLLMKFQSDSNNDVLFVKNNSKVFEDGGYKVALFSDLFDRSINTSFSEIAKNPQRLAKELQNYFHYCFDNQLIPTFTSACLFLGTDINNIYLLTEPYPDSYAIVSHLQKTLHSFRENLALEGKVSSNYAMWLDKNLEGFSDKLSIVSSSTVHNVIDDKEKQDIIDMLPD